MYFVVMEGGGMLKDSGLYVVLKQMTLSVPYVYASYSNEIDRAHLGK